MSYLPQGQYEEALGIDVWGTLKAGAAGALDVYGEAQKQAGAAEAATAIAAAQRPAVSSGLPSWVIPAAIGGGVLLLVMMMRGKKAGG